jgi:pilus assembly protein FimV
MDRLLSDTTLLGIAAAVVVVLLSLAWLLIRRRRETEGQFDESALLAPSESMTAELEKESEAAESLGQEETSFISDFSPSDIDALQEETGEVDPAAEADVYIAYGRYQQAESLINQAIEKDPDRLDLKLKLLEIYFTTRNLASFTALAEQLESAGAPEKDPQLWESVQSMGRELIPDHELFVVPESGEEAMAPESTMGGGEEEPLVSDSEELASLDLDLDTELSELQEEPSPGGAGFDEGVVLEPLPMAEPEGAAGQGEERVIGLDTEEEDLEFAIDLSDLDTLEDIDLGDLGLDSEALGTEQPIQPLIAEPEAAVKLPEEEAVTAAVVEPEVVPEEAEFELSQFDLEEPAAIELEMGEPLPEVLEEAEVLEGAEEGEGESETKLELARAYLEMGDTEGASEFLEEVLQEGSDEQKSTAKELLGKIT